VAVRDVSLQRVVPQPATNVTSDVRIRTNGPDRMEATTREEFTLGQKQKGRGL
jgi:hypothetical protein